MDYESAKRSIDSLRKYRVRQEEKTRTLQRAAALARAGKRVEAQRLKGKVDASPTVWGGDALEVMESLEQRIAELEAATDRVANAAYRAIDHLSFANYADREREARMWIQDALQHSEGE